MLWRSYSKQFCEIGAVLGTYIVCRFFGITCLVRKITGIPCPACNMSRALLALIRANFGEYVQYNAMALPVALAFVAEVFSQFAGKFRIVIHIFTVAILVINLVYYLLRLKELCI